jgi:hypothetical protein
VNRRRTDLLAGLAMFILTAIFAVFAATCAICTAPINN